MPTRLWQYHRPSDWPSALALLRSPGTRTVPLAIGPKPSPLPVREVDAVVDLSQLDLDRIHPSDDGRIHLGAMVTLQALIDSPELYSPARGLLPRSAELTAHPGIRRLATLGGALRSPGGPPEVLLALLALDAVVVTRRAGQPDRAPALNAFLSDPNGLAEGEIVVEVNFSRPAENSLGSALERIGRTPRDEAILAAVAVLESDGGQIRHARLALAGAGPRPARATTIEAMLEGQAFSDDLLARAAETAVAEADPVSDFRASAEYRRTMAGVLTRRAVAEAWKQAR